MSNSKRTPTKGLSLPSILRKKRVLIPLAAVILACVLYSVFVFSNIPFVKYLRTIYIETAMTTGDHQWLATTFIPGYIIDDVMSKQTDTSDVVGGGEHLTEINGDTADETQPADTEPPKTEDVPKDILVQNELTVGESDYAGYTVLINDIEQGLVVSEIVGSTYRGKIMLIDDPSRVYLGSTPYKHKEGLRIKAMMAHHGAIAGINASGFNDPNDSGHGGDIIGLSYSEGEYWGTAVSYYGAVLITSDDRLVVGNVKDWQYYDIRAGIQFGPVLIADGEPQIEGSGGYGIQPRTAIGQREDGVIVFLIIDGRQPTWSIGCTMGDLVEILTKYGVVNAACCDGGSSSVLAYNGEVITKNSSLNPTYGRRLPNAWLVAPKEIPAEEVTEDTVND